LSIERFIFFLKKRINKINWKIAEIEKANGSPKRGVFSFLERKKNSTKKLLKILGALKSQTKEKLKIIFKKTAAKVIKVGVLVS